MSKYETFVEEEESEEEPEGWQEYWLVVGGVSEKAAEAIESVGGAVMYLLAMKTYSAPAFYGVRLLYHPDDNDQGYCWHTDSGKRARKLFIASADAHHDLYIYCADGSVPCLESDITQLRLVTDAEWFALCDKTASEAKQEG